MNALEEIATSHAVAHGLDAADFIERVRVQAERRRQRGQLPAKECGACHAQRSALAFAEDTREVDGLKSTCRGCDVARVRERRARLGTQAD